MEITGDVLLINTKILEQIQQSIGNSETIENIADIFQALSDPTRLKIVIALNEMELCVGDVSAIVGMTKSAVSHHLRFLRNLKLVKYRRQGKMTIYGLDDDHIKTIIQQAKDHVEE